MCIHVYIYIYIYTHIRYTHMATSNGFQTTLRLHMGVWLQFHQLYAQQRKHCFVKGYVAKGLKFKLSC